jgi:hypothetical protein
MDVFKATNVFAVLTVGIKNVNSWVSRQNYSFIAL